MKQDLFESELYGSAVCLIGLVHSILNVLDDVLGVAQDLLTSHVVWIVVAALHFSGGTAGRGLFIWVSTHLVRCLYPVDLFAGPVLVVDAPDHVGIGPLARNVSLEEHVRLAEGSVEPFEGTIREEVELALVLIWIVLGLCHEQRDHWLVFVLALVVPHNVCPLDVVLVNHIDVSSHLLNRQRGSNNPL